MSSFRDSIADAGCKELHSVVDTPGGRFLCFTRCEDNTFVMCASDGLDLWKTELKSDELEAYSELADIRVEAYLAKLRTAFKSGDISLAQTGVKVTLSFGRGGQVVDMDLYEAKATEKKIHLQHVLFRLADRSTDLETKLEKAAQNMDGLTNRSIAGASTSGILDLGDCNMKKNAPRVHQQAGMSVVNPGARKRKAAKGIEFD